MKTISLLYVVSIVYHIPLLKIHVKKYHDEDVSNKISYKNVINIYQRGYWKNICLAISKIVHLSSLYIRDTTP